MFAIARRILHDEQLAEDACRNSHKVVATL